MNGVGDVQISKLNSIRGKRSNQTETDSQRVNQESETETNSHDKLNLGRIR